MHILGFRDSKASSVLIFLFTRCGKLALIGLAFFTYTVCACMHVLAFPGQLIFLKAFLSQNVLGCVSRVLNVMAEWHQALFSAIFVSGKYS